MKESYEKPAESQKLVEVSQEKRGTSAFNKNINYTSKITIIQTLCGMVLYC